MVEVSINLKIQREESVEMKMENTEKVRWRRTREKWRGVYCFRKEKGLTGIHTTQQNRRWRSCRLSRVGVLSGNPTNLAVFSKTVFVFLRHSTFLHHHTDTDALPFSFLTPLLATYLYLVNFFFFLFVKFNPIGIVSLKSFQLLD